MTSLALALLIAAATPPAAVTPTPSPTATPLVWRTYITPYAWVPNINGQVTFQTPPLPQPSIPPGPVIVDVHVGPSSYLSNLNFVAMLAAYSSRGDFSIAADYMYVNLSTSKASVVTVIAPDGRVEVPVNASTSSRLRGSIFTLDGGASLTRNSVSPIEALAGLRYLSSTSSADWNFTGPLDVLPKSGSVSKGLYVLDPIVGIRGKLGLGGSWSLPYYADYGSGSNNTTDQEYVGVAYSQDWGDIVLVNRWFNYHFTSDRIQMVGPALGVRIRL